MDIVFLRGLRVNAVIGVYGWERQIRQTLSLDLELAADVATAAASDDIADAVDYYAVSKRVTAFVEASEFRLIETLAERVAELVLSEFSVSWLRLTIAKPGAIRDCQAVGVSIERRR
ncbi:MAG TPA: dihydroneopterin aldolase [Gammaproteobacteria bacterium]|jgi:dihydroneopterin aldolase|nr:dihydroneopterin aldolase [Gammaproteobacteria bacterium]